jgi:hypothetical protein
MESILTSIKKMLGIEEAETHFDPDIIVHINTTFMTLNQLGVGPSTTFHIVDKSKTWADFLGDVTTAEAVKTYMYLQVKLLFDPPPTSYAIDAIERQLVKWEWRLNTQVESGVIYTNEIIVSVGNEVTYVHVQLATRSTWTIIHNLHSRPSVTVVDTSGTVMVGEVVYISDDEIHVNFTEGRSGKAYLN